MVLHVFVGFLYEPGTASTQLDMPPIIERRTL